MNGKKGYTSPPVGNMITCVFKKVDLKYFAPRALYRKLRKALDAEDFTVERKGIAIFEPPAGLNVSGCTINCTLSESGCEIHTYPEKGTVFFYIYSCRGPKDGRKVFRLFRKAIGNPKVTQKVQRRINVDADDD